MGLGVRQDQTRATPSVTERQEVGSAIPPNERTKSGSSSAASGFVNDSTLNKAVQDLGNAKTGIMPDRFELCCIEYLLLVPSSC